MASLRLIATLLLLSTGVCLAQHPAKPVPFTAPTEARMEKDIPALMEKAAVPGLSIAVIRDGKTVWTEGFGVRN